MIYIMHDDIQYKYNFTHKLHIQLHIQNVIMTYLLIITAQYNTSIEHYHYYYYYYSGSMASEIRVYSANHGCDSRARAEGRSASSLANKALMKSMQAGETFFHVKPVQHSSIAA